MKITLYKKATGDKVIKGEKVTITTTNGCTVTTWLDFTKSGLVLATRENMSFWGFDRVVNSYKERGYTESVKGAKV